jgi:nucleoside-diphosphate-sugar epimerase
VKNTQVLIRAASQAGVERIVHISITKPSHDSFYEYYRGKAMIEDMIRDSGLSYAIVRPTVIFGPDDILVNNIAWLARRFHLFAIPGDGRYRVRPVYVQDLADLCVRLGASRDNVVIDAVGPETFTFNDMVSAIARSVGAWHLPVHLPPALVTLVLRALAKVTKDVVLTRDEIDGLMAELVTVDSQTTCPTRLTDYLHTNAANTGTRYHSELARRR